MNATSALRRPRNLLAVVVLLVVAGIIAAIIGLQPRPAPEKAPQPPVAALIVSVAHAGESVVNLGFPTTLTVRALGDQPIASVELWLGARLLAEASNSGGGPAQVARWTWTPGEAGPAVLVARATDTRGREAQSAPLRLTVDPVPPRFRAVRPVTVEDGESAFAAAARVEGDASDLPRWNDGLDPQLPLEAGTVVYVPMHSQEVPRPDGAAEIARATSARFFKGETAVAGPGIATLASWSGAGPDVSVGPLTAGTGLFVPPEVESSVDDCTIKLAVSSDATNATGLAVYGLGPNSTAFAEVATFATGPGGSNSFTTAATAGSYLFSVSTYDSSVEEQGDLLALDVPPECGDPDWTGDATLSQGHLLVDGDVDRAYLYLSQDEGPWGRVPADPNDFVERIDGELDFSPYLPDDLASTAVDIEAWGWQGAGLLPLGTGHQDAPPPPGSENPAPVGGGGAASLFAGGTFTSLDWIAQHAPSGTPEIALNELLLRTGELVAWTKHGAVSNPLSKDFRWLTNATGVDSLVWQVAAFPMSPNLAPDIPGVLLQKVEPLKDGTQGGEFPIDFRPLFAPPAPTAKIGDVLSGGLVQQLNLAEFGAIVSAPPSPVGSPPPASGVEAHAATWLLPHFTPSVLYVRAIPMDGAKVAAEVSNFVKFTVVSDGFSIDTKATFPPGPQPTTKPSGLKPYSLVLEFTPPKNANEQFADCVLVTGFAPAVPGGLPGELGGKGNLKVGDFFCEFHGSTSGWTLAGAFEDFVDFVADAWDAVTEAWAWIQEQFAKAIAKYSLCSTIAGSDFCEGIAKVAISVALTSVGIPPSLPNTKELIALGKGELKDALIDLASSGVQGAIGVDPCSVAYLASQSLGTDSCDAIADELIDALVAEFDALRTDEAKALTGVQVPQGVYVVPHPWGTLRPPRFRVTIARNTAIPLPTTGECRMTLSMGSFVKDWPHKVYDPVKKSWGNVVESVAGEPFTRLTVSIPDPSKAEGAVEIPAAVPKDASIYEKLFAALNSKVLINRDYYLTDVNEWREPNNPGYIYVQGQGNLYFVDHGNRAWVLLQDGAGIIANITRPAYAPDCFDPVVAFGVIPVVKQGKSCVPSYGWWWDTIKKPFVGTPAQQAACAQDFATATGY